ncbi:MAG: DUF1553 domain-containing protein [Fuerstiella sp.]
MTRQSTYSGSRRGDQPKRWSLLPSTFAAVLLCLQSPHLSAADLTPQQRDLFENHVRPTLVKHCIKCHGETKQEGGLRLTSIEGLLSGGDSGPAIVPGRPDESLLLEALRYESFEMPPGGQLKVQVADGVADWIKAGAPWPQELILKPTKVISEQDRDWWCYQPVSNPAVPEADSSWCRNEIDHFILHRLKAAGLSPATEADFRKLARRVHFAVTGLPPTQATAELVDSFVAAAESPENPKTSVIQQADWYEGLVDQLLQDSAYGENQARYWLDLVRYADSDGYNADHARPEAWHYRDYVIRSFNDDKPYDRFLREQLAGDEIDPGNRDALIATMYLRHWIYEHNQRDVEGQWAQILSDVTETTADVFLAQGLKCARCHDHKFDPLLQRDYYAMRAFFTPLKPREDQPIADVETRSQYLAQQRVWEQATSEIRKRLHEIETPELLAHATREGVHRFTKEIQRMVSSRAQDLSPYENQIATLASKQFDVLPEKLPEWLDRAEEAERQDLLTRLAEFDHLKPQPLPTMKFVVSDVGPVAPPTMIPDVPDATPIEPAFPVVLEHGEPAKIEPPHEALQSTGRRTALAEWITSPDNPLTARVIVNRVWQQHFGRGLVETTSDFGHLGTPPSHPELLDWLACRFMQDGWSFKKLHRLILTSATYRQSSGRPMDEQLATLDPQNELLWRMNPRRLSGEEIHDCVISACGEIGPGKRAIFKPVKRNSLDPLLAAFDFPDRVESQCRRHRTTTSPQSLLMMNDPWLHERAEKLAADIGVTDLDSLVQAAYQRLYFRPPSRDELQLAASFLNSFRSTTEIPQQPQRLASLPDGRPAIVLKPDLPASVRIAPISELLNSESDGDFTIEATVMLHSLYPDASVRTIVAGWSDRQTERGWSLGVTSTKSRYQPGNLILQLIGSRHAEKEKPEYEVVPSDLRLELNRPYYLAVSIDLDDTSDSGITFYLQDLSGPDGELQVASVPHQACRGVQADRPIEIGGRSGHHVWDGLIHRVRLHQTALSREELSAGKEAVAAAEPAGRSALKQLLFDVRFADPDHLGRDESGYERHATVTDSQTPGGSVAAQARVALLHALLCSNEVIYVD